MPIILTEEKEKEKEKGKEGDRGGREEAEGGLEDLCVHACTRTHKYTHTR